MASGKQRVASNEWRVASGKRQVTMPAMVRKQIYIEERHERLLKRISKVRGLGEAELIRRAIERETIGGKPLPVTSDQGAWHEIGRFVKKRKSLRSGGRPYRCNRLNAYKEREECLMRPAK